MNRVVVISFFLSHPVCTGEVGGRQPGADLKPSGPLSLSYSNDKFSVLFKDTVSSQTTTTTQTQACRVKDSV